MATFSLIHWFPLDIATWIFFIVEIDTGLLATSVVEDPHRRLSEYPSMMADILKGGGDFDICVQY